MTGDSWMRDQDQYQDEELKSSNLVYGSPQGPLNIVGRACGISSIGGNSTEDEEDRKSESYSEKKIQHKSK